MRKLFYLGLVIIFFASCEKDNSDSENNSEVEVTYLPLKVGNYWIYKNYSIDSSGEEFEKSNLDSVVIDRDTTINDKQYYVMEGTDYPLTGSEWKIIGLFRDSCGYIVNEKGEIKLSVNNFVDTLDYATYVSDSDTLYTLSYQMEKLSSTVTVPAGEFSVLNFKGTVILTEEFEGIENPRYIDNLYADNVGKVLESNVFYHSTTIWEKRLVRYNIQSE